MFSTHKLLEIGPSTLDWLLTKSSGSPAREQTLTLHIHYHFSLVQIHAMSILEWRKTNQQNINHTGPTRRAYGEISHDDRLTDDRPQTDDRQTDTQMTNDRHMTDRKTARLSHEPYLISSLHISAMTILHKSIASGPASNYIQAHTHLFAGNVHDENKLNHNNSNVNKKLAPRQPITSTKPTTSRQRTKQCSAFEILST